MSNFGVSIVHKLLLSKTKQFVSDTKVTHPAVQIYIWICLALFAQILHGYALMLLAGILLVLAFRLCRERFFFLLRRTRWILLSVLIIYAYSSPADVLWPQLGAFSPVAEGLEDGVMQLSRLLTMLAGLSVLLTLLTQAQLVTGLHALSAPLGYLGLARERIAVRLALTMRYAETVMQDTASNWRGSMEYFLAPAPVAPGLIELHDAPFSRSDLILFAMVTVLLMGVWL
jgi:energy-coupling factor transporter transmembrane protein EcfT